MKKIWSISLLFALILVLAACGGKESSSSDQSNGTESTIEMVASNWKFDQETYTVPAGKVTFNLKNEEGYHGISIEGTNLKIDGDGSASVVLEPGEYKVKCSIPCGGDHDTMEATIIVQ